MTLQSIADYRLRWIHRNAGAAGSSLGDGRDDNDWQHKNSWTDGSGDDQSQVMWHDIRTVTPATGTDDLDLTGGVTNKFGKVVTFTTVKDLIIENLGVYSVSSGLWTPTDGENLLIGGQGAGAFSDLFNGVNTSKFKLLSGSPFIVRAPLTGYSLGGGADTLRIQLSGSGSNDVDYAIVITGVGTEA